MSKKMKKGLKKTTRYAIEYPSDNPLEVIQRSCFTLTEVEYHKNEEYSNVIILPKKIDSILRKTEKLGLDAVEIFTDKSTYAIRFIEDDCKFQYGGDMLNDLYVSKPAKYVNFVWDEKRPSSPKTFELVISLNGDNEYSKNHPCINVIEIINIFNALSDLKEYLRRLDIVYKEIKRNKKSKLKKYYSSNK